MFRKFIFLFSFFITFISSITCHEHFQYESSGNDYLDTSLSLARKKEFTYSQETPEKSYRSPKLFPLFTIIRFANDACKTTNDETGVCYTRYQCTSLGGVAQGSCASGLGVCCRFIATCGASVYQNGTSFRNPNYPSKYLPTGGSEVCQVRVRKQQNVCQLRLNFIAFDVESPLMHTSTANPPAAMNDVGQCRNDSLAITSSGATVPSLCGNLNGQHLYVDFGTSDTITLNLLLGGTTQKERTWNIEILTIPCNSLARAPSGCLQYFTGVSGRLESFNYQTGMGLHLANLDYAVCIRLEESMRFIDWTPCTQNDVRIGGGTGATCVNDYLIIPQGIRYPPGTTETTPATSTTDRFCDNSFTTAGSYVRTSAKPFFMHVHTDNSEGTANDATSIGYCFRWQQNPH